MAAELVKNQINAGRRRELYHFRDQQGLEVDFVAPAPEGALQLIEVKWTRTVTPAMARPIQRVAAAVGSRGAQGVIVTRGEAAAGPRPVVPGVRTASVDEFLVGS